MKVEDAEAVWVIRREGLQENNLKTHETFRGWRKRVEWGERTVNEWENWSCVSRSNVWALGPNPNANKMLENIWSTHADVFLNAWRHRVTKGKHTDVNSCSFMFYYLYATIKKAERMRCLRKQGARAKRFVKLKRRCPWDVDVPETPTSLRRWCPWDTGATRHPIKGMC